MKRIAILVRTGHELDADTRMAFEHLRSAHIRATEKKHDDLRGRVCRHIWIEDDEELEAALNILQGARISAIRA
jgi:hypothetical protein